MCSSEPLRGWHVRFRESAPLEESGSSYLGPNSTKCFQGAVKRRHVARLAALPAESDARSHPTVGGCRDSRIAVWLFSDPQAGRRGIGDNVLHWALVQILNRRN